MCGIFGYIGKSKAVPIILNGLEHLEYRGYDSAGICVVNKQNLQIIKSAGKIAELKSSALAINPEGDIGIGHTRWATHGEPSSINAHPHTDCKHSIAIVHNGIIENHTVLRKMLESKGHRFVSQTDSEVIAHLIEEYYNGDLEEAVIECIRCLNGTFAIAAIHKNEKRIVVARRSSPIVIGVGDNGMIISSDTVAFPELIKRVVYLGEDEIASVYLDGFSVKRITGQRVLREAETREFIGSMVDKGNYAHFMLKEIFEQPDSIRNFLAGRLKNGLVKITPNISLENVNRIIFIGCGTSFHAGLVGKYLLENMLKIPVVVEYASEFKYREPVLYDTDLVIAISQSGETADTLSIVKDVKSKGIRCLGIVNVVGSSIAREVDGGIYLHAGPELSVASTKAFTSQVLAILSLGLYFKQEKGMKISQELVKHIELLPVYVNNTLRCNELVQRISAVLKNHNSVMFLGRDINYPVALEGALKLKEVAYIHSDAYPAGEMKHGPIALVDNEFPVVFIATKNIAYEKALANIQEVKSRGAKIISIVNDNDSEVGGLSDFVIRVPHVPYELSPIINVIPLQLIAYHTANQKGLDVDKPRNLAKSVTVE